MFCDSWQIALMWLKGVFRHICESRNLPQNLCPPKKAWHCSSVKESEFWNCVERAFPDGRGTSLVQDLVLSALGDRSCKEALDAGMDPQRVWDSICKASDFPEKYRYLYRINPRDM
ncbi:DUF3046 domain-containing protein [Actinotignum urinale]|uniref:DUF3046 domain-containing protein n=2 Tax=Actinotignum urinale TaxID=190146 RepID=UPI0027D2F876|nr:DUF3046 domain-containing protein [Actinotignum urinale]